MSNIEKANSIDYWRTFGINPSPFDPAATQLSGFGEDAPKIHFEQFPGHVPAAALPDGMIAFGWVGENTDRVFVDFSKSLEVPPLLRMQVGKEIWSVYRLPEGEPLPNAVDCPEGMKVYSTGDIIALPYGDDLAASLKTIKVPSLAEAPQLPAGVLKEAPLFKPRKRNALDQYSLKGLAETMAAEVQDMKPLLGNICYSGQATVWYAPPNAGKTLLTLHLLFEAIGEGRLDGDRVFYINADDSAHGLVDKMRLADDYGVNVIAPGYKGFKNKDLVDLLEAMAEKREVEGVVLIFDTIKKYADLMSKSESSAFAETCRAFVMAGGSILGLAHTTKHAGANGKHQYAGTTDLIDDFDAAYILSPIDEAGNEKVVVFEQKKGRGAGARSVAYAFNNQSETPYTQRLASVRMVDPEQLDKFQRVAEEAEDADVIEAIVNTIADETVTKMALAKAVSKKVSVGRHKAVNIIERYTGTDPERHYWTFTVGERGAKTYSLLGTPPARGSQ